ncbi:PREDICTED: growth/differentiation factor 8-like [Acropora digitifera]|uniref:growth/differentiation factor 8-like n=1 Tax=Acropora digitifera TaxID=70779 RepID=UPI00077ADA5D|nr:PREDICTED: growth/differentiation factor 8-like [Acropora digitifera]
MICAVLVILCLHFEPLSCHLQKSNLLDNEQNILQSFKRKLLKELGLTSAPNVSAEEVSKIPEVFKSLVDEENRNFLLSAKERDNFHAKTEEFFLFPDQGTSVIDPAGESYVFKPIAKNVNLEIESANLWFNISNANKCAGKDGFKGHSVDIYKYFQTPGLETKSQHGEIFHSMYVNGTGWHVVELSHVLEEWLHFHAKCNLSVTIATSKTICHQESNVSNHLETVKGREAFFAVVLKKKKPISRERREADNRPNDDDEVERCGTECCLHPLRVSFAKLRWNFILSPKLLNVNVCNGSCASRAFHINSIRSNALGLVNLEKPTCCKPDKMAPIKFLYLDEDLRLKMHIIAKMQVVSCDCIL